MGTHLIKQLAIDLVLLSATWVIDIKNYFDVAASLLIMVTAAIRFIQATRKNNKK